MRELRIGSCVINDQSDCFVIAEIGHNHQGNLDLCKQMFKVAKECGASAVKLQKRNNIKLYTKEFYDSAYNSENSFGATYGLHREALEFGEKEYQELKRYADELGILFFATAFDVDSANFLQKLDVPCFKMASGDLTNIPLLKHVAHMGKPMILSTGGALLEDVHRAYQAVFPINPNIAILQCTASYPCNFDHLNLRVIETYRREFPDVVIGFSAHDNGVAMPVVAYTLGARIVEKHFTLNRASKGTDQAFSLEPSGLKKMIRDLQRTRVALGTGEKCIFEEEKKPILKMGKKIVAARDLSSGHVIQEIDIEFKSPADGLLPYHVDLIIYGKKLVRDLKQDEAIASSDVVDISS